MDFSRLGYSKVQSKTLFRNSGRDAQKQLNIETFQSFKLLYFLCEIGKVNASNSRFQLKRNNQYLFLSFTIVFQCKGRWYEFSI